MDTQYYVDLDGQEFGPYDLEQMQAFGLMPNIKVYSTSTKEWASAISYPELIDYITSDSVSNTDVDLYNRTYYLRLEEGIYGPYSLPEFAFLDIVPESVVSIDNMQNWQAASEIEGLLPALDLLSSGETISPITNSNLNTKELEEVIEEQEQEIIELKGVLDELRDELDKEKELRSNIPVYNISIDGTIKYTELREELCALAKSNIFMANSSDTVYRKVFPTAELEKAY